MNTGNSSSYNPGQYPVFPKKKRAVWPWILASVLIILFVIVPVVTVVVMVSTGAIEEDWSYDNEYVAVLYIEGTITGSSDGYIGISNNTYNQQYLVETVQSLMNDPMNVGLMLYINSPGGELYATDELYRELLKYKENNRPIYAYCAEMAASGGYYLACASDKIYTNPLCTTGSIGVTYGTHIDVSEFLKKLGITATALASDNNKMMGNIFSPLTEEQRAIYDSQIEEYYMLFLDVVGAARGMKEMELRPLADGRVYTAKQALKNGLIDGTCTLEEAIDKFFTDNEIADTVNVEEFSYSANEIDLYSMFMSATGINKQANTTELEAYLSAIDYFNGPLVYYTGP